MDESVEKLQEVLITVDGKKIDEKELRELQAKPNIRLIQESPNVYRTLHRMNG